MSESLFLVSICRCYNDGVRRQRGPVPEHYRQAVEYLYGFADFERLKPVSYRDFNLHRVRALLELLGNPHLGVPTVHVAGTKGKGSTVAMIASVLEAAGVRAGVLTSPHLHTIRERIAVGGTSISEEEFACRVEKLRPVVGQVNEHGDWGRLTTFELLTAAAFLHFREAKAEAVVVEVGLGGRLDATNVVEPMVCGITNISLDHTEVLGDALEKIAGEKAAIIKPGAETVISPQPGEALRVIEEKAREAGSAVTLVGRDVQWIVEGSDFDAQDICITTEVDRYNLRVPLLGDHQAENAATAVAICEGLARGGVVIAREAVHDGMAKVSWPGRLEVLSREPMVVADGAHNPYSMSRLVEAVTRRLPRPETVVVFGATGSKDLGGMIGELALLSGLRRVVATRSRHPRAVSPEEVEAQMSLRGITVDSAPDVALAVARACELIGDQGLVLVTGSLFVVAEAREAILGIIPETFERRAPVGV